MRILVWLPDDEAYAGPLADRYRHQIRRVRTIPSLIEAIRSSQADVVLVDPEPLRTDVFEQVVAGADAGKIPVVFYAIGSQLAVQRILLAAGRCLVGVALRDEAGAMSRLNQAIETATDASAGVLAVRELGPRLRHLPSSLAAAVVPVFFGARSPKTVGDLARHARMPRRSMDRWIRRAGFRGASALLDVARLVHGRDILAGKVDGPRGDIPGFQSSRTARACFHRVLGVPPTTAARTLTAALFVAKAIEWLLAGRRRPGIEKQRRVDL